MFQLSTIKHYSVNIINDCVEVKLLECVNKTFSESEVHPEIYKNDTITTVTVTVRLNHPYEILYDLLILRFYDFFNMCFC